jgi:hypothetical protein
MAYAAYLRIYEPISAFHEPDRSRWSAYAASPVRPRRRDALAAEQAAALRRLVTEPDAVIPERESEHAYVRCVDGTLYICPWQTRLRSLLICGAILARSHPAAQPYIRSSVWTVPLPWFVPFAGAERWIAFGHRVPAQPGPRSAPLAGRSVIYTTLMPLARERLARCRSVLRGGWRDCELADPGMADELADLGRWLERFHPRSLLELDYGGLVYLFSDAGLSGDESVAEVGAAIDGAASGQRELALAMYARVSARWRAAGEYEQVN